MKQSMEFFALGALLERYKGANIKTVYENEVLTECGWRLPWGLSRAFCKSPQCEQMPAVSLPISDEPTTTKIKASWVTCNPEIFRVATETGDKYELYAKVGRCRKCGTVYLIVGK